MDGFMKLLASALCLALVGCGTSSTLRGEQQTDYIIASQARIGGVWKFIRGEGTTCKLTTHGITGLKYRIGFDGENCVVEAAE